MGRLELKNARKNKKDEFYTLMVDIERELKFYSQHFNNKVILCNCDNPTVSNFYKYLVENFKEFNIKKVIAISYKENSKGLLYIYNGDNKKHPSKNDLIELKGDGDFRSQECIKFIQQADLVITNPPFSLFREYIENLFKNEKKFLIISNINAITYKNVFERIQNNEVWLGINYGRGISGFVVPNEYDLYGTETKISDNGIKIISPNNCMWLTNLEHSKRKEIYPLKHFYKNNEYKYEKYDNFDAINVDRTSHIPKDYNGNIGVPITF